MDIYGLRFDRIHTTTKLVAALIKTLVCSNDSGHTSDSFLGKRRRFKFAVYA